MGGFWLSYLAGAGVFLAALVGVVVVLARISRLYLASVPGPDTKLGPSDQKPSLTGPGRAAADLVSSAILGLGILAMLFPLLLWWWLHGSPERYMWIISGPYPYDRLGGGPTQLWIGAAAGGIGLILFLIGVLIRRKYLMPGGNSK